MIFESVDDNARKKLKLDHDGAETEESDGDIWASDDDFRPNITNDEFYGSRPDASENSDIGALRRIHAKQGYLDGLSSKKEETLQKGFDSGYPLGGNLGISTGRILGDLLSLSCLDNDTGKRAKELLIEAKRELHIRRLLNNKYFDDDLNLLNGTHLVIQEWEEKVRQLKS